MSQRVSGLTLAEWAVVATVAAVLLAAVFQALVAQQRRYREQTAIDTIHRDAAAPLATLVAELRQVSATGGDLVAATEELATFRSVRKMGIVCGIRSHEPAVVVREFGRSFAPGDSVLVFRDQGPAHSTEGTWRVGRVHDKSPATCGNQWDGRADGKGSAALLVGDGLVDEGVGRGTPILAFEHVTYGAFEVDGSWYIGRQEADSIITPLVGPIAPPKVGGFSFRYFDRHGLPIEPSDARGRARVARIELTVRGPTFDSGGAGSFTMDVALRGNALN